MGLQPEDPVESMDVLRPCSRVVKLGWSGAPEFVVDDEKPDTTAFRSGDGESGGFLIEDGLNVVRLNRSHPTARISRPESVVTVDASPYRDIANYPPLVGCSGLLGSTGESSNDVSKRVARKLERPALVTCNVFGLGRQCARSPMPLGRPERQVVSLRRDHSECVEIRIVVQDLNGRPQLIKGQSRRAQG